MIYPIYKNRTISRLKYALFIQLKLQAQNNITATSLDFRLNNGALLSEEVCVLNSGINDGVKTKIMAVAQVQIDPIGQPEIFGGA